MAAGYDISASASQSLSNQSAVGPVSSGGLNFSGSTFDFGGGSSFVPPGTLSKNLMFYGFLALTAVAVVYIIKKKN